MARIFSQEHRKNLSLAHKGRKLSVEHRQKLSDAKKGKYPGHGFQKGHNPFYKGKKMPENLVEQNRRGHLGTKLTPEHRMKISLSMRGSKSSLWRGGVSALNSRQRAIFMMGVEYKLWRDAVFARDGWICQKYGLAERRIVAHHIYNYSQFPELRTSIQNGITLSEKAHKEFHKKYGFRNNTREQLDEFLNENNNG